MKKQPIILKVIFIVSMILAMFYANAQDYSKALAAADTSNFSPNKKDGWQILNSYVATKSKDSVVLELVTVHEKNIDLTKEQYIGNIKLQALQPEVEQTILFNWITDEYQLRLDIEGKCFLKFISGIGPTTSPMIIPIEVFYKLKPKI